jgi:type IV secretory pathway VirB3-like protein
MAYIPEERIEWDALSVGATRPAMLKGVPFAFIPFIFFGPVIVVFLSWNPAWLLLMIPLTILARALVARDYNMPRVLLLWMLSGAAFADRSEWGGDSPDVLTGRDPWFGITHE